MARVLIVDDEVEALELRARILARDGHDIATASDAVTARQLFRDFQPERVILDLRLPEAADGFALIREFRAAAPDLHILVLSGQPADLDGRAEQSMANTILRKPVRSEQLRLSVAQRR